MAVLRSHPRSNTSIEAMWIEGERERVREVEHATPLSTAGFGLPARDTEDGQHRGPK